MNLIELIASPIFTNTMKPAQPGKPVTIAMADDHKMLRNALAQLIEGFGGYKVVAHASNGIELIEKLGQMESPELLLLDIGMPEMNGIETAKEVSRLFPQIKIIALSMMDNELSVVGMVKNGARGFILKDAEPSHIKAVLENVSKKGFHFTEKSEKRILYSLQQDNGHPGRQGPKLSEREVQFCILACSEMTYKEIAEKMGVSPRTVDGYRDGLFEKLGLKTRVGIAMYALKNQLILI